MVLLKTRATMTLLLVRVVSPSCVCAGVARVAEAGVAGVDAGVDDAHLHARARVRAVPPTAVQASFDEDLREIRIVVGDRSVDALVLRGERPLGRRGAWRATRR